MPKAGDADLWLVFERTSFGTRRPPLPGWFRTPGESRVPISGIVRLPLDYHTTATRLPTIANDCHCIFTYKTAHSASQGPGMSHDMKYLNSSPMHVSFPRCFTVAIVWQSLAIASLFSLLCSGNRVAVEWQSQSLGCRIFRMKCTSSHSGSMLPPLLPFRWI